MRALLLGLLLGSCVQVEPKPDFDRTRELITESTGQSHVYSPYEASISESELDELLVDGLSLEEALTLALSNNYELQADFQEIGIANAEWVQAQLLPNPSLDLLLRFPRGGGRSLLEANLGIELLDLWRVPAKTEAARQNLDAVVLRIARRAGERAAETESRYYAAVAAEELLAVAASSVELAERSYQAVQDLHSAGAADALAESIARGPLLAARAEERAARVKTANARRELAKQLSLHRAVETLVLSDSLPTTAASELDAEKLVELALEARLDLRAIVATIETLDTRMTNEERAAWGQFSAGVNLERPAGSGSSAYGPAVSLSLPLFDQNQAQVARAGFELHQMRLLLEAARVAVTQNVRSGTARVNAASSNLRFYSEELLPQSQLALDLAAESYAAGNLPLFELVEVKRGVLSTRESQVLLRLEAATAAAELERIVGTSTGRLVDVASSDSLPLSNAYDD